MGDLLTDTDQLDDQPKRKIAAANASMQPISARGIGGTADAPPVAPIAKPLPTTNQPSPQRAADTAELQRLETTGSGISRIKNPVGRGVLRGIEALGSIVAPWAVSQIPGTELHHRVLVGQQRGAINTDITNEEREAQTQNLESETQARQNPQIKDAFELWRQQHPNDDISKFFEMEQGAKDTGPKDPFALWREQNPNSPVGDFFKAQQDAKPANTKDQDIADYLAANKMEDTAANREKARNAIANRGKQEPGTYMPLYDGNGQIVGAWNPKDNSVHVPPKLPGTTSQGMAASRADVRTHDKDYVLPAEQTERAYQLYKEAQRAYESGDAKTGAASMLALSQHLGTTFGQIKGSRMNRDLIQEHKDAIGWEDKIQRYIDNIKTGQQLSASQIKEFGNLIGNMRQLTWQMAAGAADRKHIPVDFLPPDLSNIPHVMGQSQNVSGGHVSFKEGNDVYDIPPDKVNDFKQKHPNAVQQ